VAALISLERHYAYALGLPGGFHADCARPHKFTEMGQIPIRSRVGDLVGGLAMALGFVLHPGDAWSLAPRIHLMERKRVDIVLRAVQTWRRSAMY
jgi:hypothetical protein